MSFLKSKGTWFKSTSLMTPPTVPVIVPIIIQTQKGSPASILLVIPTTVNKPSPIVSNKNNVLPSFRSRSLNIRTDTSATPVVRKYFGSNIQKGVTSSNKSRKVPPPIAVTRPRIYAPNQSICLPEACLMPLTAKAKVPNKSRSVVKVICTWRLY